jgi:hypothetical protein
MRKQPNGTPGKKPPALLGRESGESGESFPLGRGADRRELRAVVQLGGYGRYPILRAGGAMALGLAIIGVLAGIALGLRYKVLFLVPAVTLAMIFATMIGVARADHFWSIVLAMVVLGTAVQFGYLAGIAIRAAVGSVVPLPHAQVAQRHAP